MLINPVKSTRSIVMKQKENNPVKKSMQYMKTHKINLGMFFKKKNMSQF